MRNDFDPSHDWTESTPQEAKRRLSAILNDKVLRFNPYRVNDEELLACAERGRWRSFPALTQMVILHFLDIREVPAQNRFEALFFRLGDSDDEHFFPLGVLLRAIAHHALKTPVKSQVNDKNIVRSNIERLQHKSFFVSHIISDYPQITRQKLAYKMYRLKGSVAEQANTIRLQMVRSKITMLEEVLNYPGSPLYLGYNGKEFDYVTPIRNAIATIFNYPNQSSP